MAEMSYEFVANMVRTTAGTEAMKFFPLVFSLFMFILIANLFGMFPYFFTVTSHIIITAALAILVFVMVVVYGFWRNGLKFLKLFVPSGIPIYILPLVVLIEVISFLSRPLSLSLRLFGNILAGHIVLKVFGGMVVALLGAGAWGIARDRAVRHGDRADRPRVPRRGPPGLRVHRPHLRLPPRRNPSRPLRPDRLSHPKETEDYGSRCSKTDRCGHCVHRHGRRRRRRGHHLRQLPVGRAAQSRPRLPASSAT